MRFGLAIDFGTRRATLDRVVEEFIPALRLAERYGFDSVVAGETYPSGPGYSHLPSPLLILANLASRTTLRLGTGVTLLPGWHPLKLAYDCAILDQLSGGRFVLGIGVANLPDWPRFGRDRANRGRQLDETLQALKALWRGEPGYHGKYIQIDQRIEPLPIQPGGPPILVGGLVPRAAERAARYADGWYAATSYRLADIAAQAERYRTARQAAGQDPTTGVVAANRLTWLAETTAGLPVGKPHVAQVLKSYAVRGGIVVGAADEQPRVLAADLPDLVEQATPDVCLIGTPDQVCEQVARYQAAGVTDIQMRLAPGDLPAELVAQTIRLAGEQILPRFR